MNRMFLAAVALSAFSPLAAAVHRFTPSDAISIRTEPRGFEEYVTVSQAADRVVFDCRKAYAEGMKNLVCELERFEDPSLAGKDVLFEVFAGAEEGFGRVNVYLLMWKEKNGKKIFHALRPGGSTFVFANRDVPVRCVETGTCPEKSGGYRLRFDFTRPAKNDGVYYFKSGRVAPMSEVKVTVKPEKVKPELTMHLPFDGSTRAAFAKGRAEPLTGKGVSFAEGKRGQAVRITEAAGTTLEYAFKDNLSRTRGAVSMWLKRDPSAKCKGSQSKWLLASALPFGSRMGSGALYLWLWGADRLRMEASDDCDAYVYKDLPSDGEWHHVIASWNEAGCTVFVDGAPGYDDVGGVQTLQTLRRAYRPYDFSAPGRGGAQESFFIGSLSGREQPDVLLDEVKFFSASLTRDDARRLYLEEGGDPSPPRVDYARLSELRGRNVYETAPSGKDGDFGETELVKEIRFTSAGLAELKASGAMFDAVGPTRLRKTADGREYLEAGNTLYDRFAVGFDIDPSEPFYVVEIDYPDDAKRTMDVVVQDALNPLHDAKWLQNSEMQVGILTGGDYPLSGKIRTHRCIYWTHRARIATVFMTNAGDCPAAVSAVRVYRVKNRALPAARIAAPEKADGWGRTFGWYYEDPSINNEFGIKDCAASPETCLEMVDKIAALMKFQGLDMFAYPGTWYDGVIGGAYNPRNHAPDFLKAFYERFDREGLGFVPVINQIRRPVPPGSLTYGMLVSGEVHASMFSVTSSGRPETGRAQGASLFNVCHPDTRKYLEGMIDLFVADGVKHPSFRGVGLHVTHCSLCWLGTIESGYNDYMIDGFTRDTGIKVPVDRGDPMRGKAYAEWLLKNAYGPWVKWRCRQVSGFWVKIAAKLRAARPDLKLWINNIANLDPRMSGFTSVDYMSRIALEGGLDREIFAREAPNVIMSQTSLPADYRYARPGFYYATEADYECQRTYHTKPYYWDFLEGASYPLVHMHDRYWETHPGNPVRNRDPARRFKADWFKEVKYRVSALNAAGPYAMEHYAVPLRFRDILGFTKGGIIVGTYGMEEYLVPFARAFRALPAVTMETLPGGGDFIRLRYAEYGGKTYFYIVNTGVDAVTVGMRFPEGTEDLVTGGRLSGKKTVQLGPYELRSYRAPSGRPELTGYGEKK